MAEVVEMDLDGISFPQRDIWGAVWFMNYLRISDQVSPSSESMLRSTRATPGS